MGTGGKKPEPKRTPVYLVASASNSGYNHSFDGDEDLFFDAGKAEQYRAQKDAGLPANYKKPYYYIVTLWVKE